MYDIFSKIFYSYIFTSVKLILVADILFSSQIFWTCMKLKKKVVCVVYILFSKVYQTRSHTSLLKNNMFWQYNVWRYFKIKTTFNFMKYDLIRCKSKKSFKKTFVYWKTSLVYSRTLLIYICISLIKIDSSKVKKESYTIRLCFTFEHYCTMY